MDYCTSVLHFSVVIEHCNMAVLLIFIRLEVLPTVHVLLSAATKATPKHTLMCLGGPSFDPLLSSHKDQTFTSGSHMSFQLSEWCAGCH